VRPGQTLSDIAKAYGTTVPALLEHNGIRDARDLRAGQVVAIPADAGNNNVLAALRSDAGYFHHRVRRGQTLSDIAKQYGTSVSELQRYNGIRDARRLQARQVIRIPTS
jgi:membrane-bound lytic murein transglycosylase D